MSFHYMVDLDKLDESITDMGTFDAAVGRHMGTLDSIIAKLHGHWQGEAAAAQKEAHARWTRGAEEMRNGLTGMREAVKVAHGNYQSAGDTNARMWRQVR